jgi:FtsZ-binding cell division protein ZapB
MNYARHFLSACWPEMSEEEYAHLKDSIAYSGLRDPIVLMDGEVLDGWHRYRACIEIGVDPVFSEFSDLGESDPAQYVRDKHTRRSLSHTQNLTCIALMNQWKRPGRPVNSAPGAQLSASDMAKQAGGSLRSAVQVKEAITKGAPELVAAMKNGDVSAKKAAAIAKLPKEDQAAVIDKPLPKPEKITPPAPNGHADELAESAQAISDLAEENEALKAQLAVKHMDGTGEEKAQAATIISDLRAEVKTLNMELKAMRSSRDMLQAENGELKKQVAMYQRQIKREQRA